MEYADYGLDQETGAVCDYRLYDRIWQRVSPELNPYPHIRDQEREIAPAEPEVRHPAPRGETVLPPGREEEAPPETGMQPCCMGAAAGDSLQALKGFLEEELAESRCCAALSRQACSRSAARLLHRMAMEKREAARRLQAACYLIDGTRCTPEVPLERTRFSGLAEALRHCYHQDACNGFAYGQAAEETEDRCLRDLLNELSRQAYRRADAVMRLLGEVLC